MRSFIFMLLALPATAAEGSLFNGKDLSGWVVRKTGEKLEGKTEAEKGRFAVKDGVLLVNAKVKGDITLDTVQSFEKDVTITFEFLPGAGCNNDLYIRGAKFDIKPNDIKSLKLDEWNSFEIIVKGQSAEFKCNGETIKTIKLKPGATPFGIRAEAGPIHFRKLESKP